MKLKRRLILKIGACLAVGWSLAKMGFKVEACHSQDIKYLGVAADGRSKVYLVQNGSPQENLYKVMELFGGIHNLINEKDIVIIKPNAQWWYQGITNTDTLKAFIQLILEIPKFKGEIIIAENHHFQDDNSRGWITNKRNGQYNLNELVNYFQAQGYHNVTKYHWHDGGSTYSGYHGGAHGGGIVNGPQEGDGYVWCQQIEYKSRSGYKTIMSYPIFTSSYSGITIDLKNGAWKDGHYIDIPVKLINFSSLNHHGNWAGATASIKNYLGIVDMTCGFRGKLPSDYKNFHFVGVKKSVLSKIHWRLEALRKKYRIGYVSHFDGGAVGCFMRTIRIADFNIISAEWVGWGSRTDPSKAVKARCVLASKDPVALDYIACRDILCSVTPVAERCHKYNYSYKVYNNPELEKLPLNMYLKECHQQGIGNIDPHKIDVICHDFKNS